MKPEELTQEKLNKILDEYHQIAFGGYSSFIRVYLDNVFEMFKVMGRAELRLGILGWPHTKLYFRACGSYLELSIHPNWDKPTRKQRSIVKKLEEWTAGINEKWREADEPYPYPFACGGCGKCYKEGTKVIGESGYVLYLCSKCLVKRREI